MPSGKLGFFCVPYTLTCLRKENTHDLPKYMKAAFLTLPRLGSLPVKIILCKELNRRLNRYYACGNPFPPVEDNQTVFLRLNNEKVSEDCVSLRQDVRDGSSKD